MYDDKTRFIKKGTSFKWGKFFQIFKNQSFPLNEEDGLELKISKIIRKSKLHRVETHATVFPCADEISWIVQ
jgi:hypothetical protein